MKKHIVFILLLFVAVQSRAQYRAKADSLHALMMQDRNEETGDLFRHIEKHYPDSAFNDPVYQRHKALNYGFHEVNKAIPAMERAVFLDPSAENLLQLGHLYSFQGDHVRAATAIAKAYEKEPSLKTSLQLVHAYRFAREYGKLEPLLTEIPPEYRDANYWEITRECKMALRKLEGALEACTHLGRLGGYNAALCQYEACLILGRYDSIPALIPALLPDTVLLESAYDPFYKETFYRSLLAKAQKDYAGNGDILLFDSTIKEALKYSNPESIETDTAQTRAIAMTYFSHKGYASAYYFLSYIDKPTLADYQVIVDISNQINCETWLTKKARKKLKK